MRKDGDEDVGWARERNGVSEENQQSLPWWESEGVVDRVRVDRFREEDRRELN